MTAADGNSFDRPTRSCGRAGAGFGLLALADLLNRDAARAGAGRAARAEAAPLPRQGQVGDLAVHGGRPEAVDLFDPKPELDKHHGQGGCKIDVFNGSPGPLMKSPFKFDQHGQTGAWVCDQYPNVAQHVDDFAFVKSLLHRVERPRAGAVPDEHRDVRGPGSRRPGRG